MPKFNFGFIIPTQSAKIEEPIDNTEKTVDEQMKGMVEDWRYRWCDSGRCACLGAANCSGHFKGTKEEWEQWVKDNPDIREKQAGYGFNSYEVPYKKFE